tara:strand:- start:19103 stop:19327 length:225 start_codon:yes stop_codon:yes gene_type:complete
MDKIILIMTAKKVMVRLGFSDMVVTMEEAMDNTNEICSPDSFVAGYEDENGKECNSDGTYFDQIDPKQIGMFDD